MSERHFQFCYMLDSAIFAQHCPLVPKKKNKLTETMKPRLKCCYTLYLKVSDAEKEEKKKKKEASVRFLFPRVLYLISVIIFSNHCSF